MTLSIQAVVNGMISQLEGSGVSPSTVAIYRDDLCASIIKYCMEQGAGIYSEQTLELYLDRYREKVASGKTSQMRFSYVLRTVRLLKSYAETGHTDFSRTKAVSKYDPSPKYWALADQLLEENQVANGSRTYLHYYMRHFFCFLERNNLSLSDITDETFFQFIDSVSEINKGSIGQVLRALNFISSHLKENGIAKLQMNLSLLPIKRLPIRIIAPFSQEEIERIISIIDASTPTGMRDKAVILLAFHTGLRAGDIIRLKRKDIDWKSGTISVVQQKTKQPLELPLTGNVMNAIADYILKARPETSVDEIFLTTRAPAKPFSRGNSLCYVLEKYCQAAGVKKVRMRSFHSLRRAFATELSMQGVPLGEISEMLGHRCIESGKSYLSYNGSQISLCAADFNEIPLTTGIYSGLFANAPERTVR